MLFQSRWVSAVPSPLTDSASTLPATRIRVSGSAVDQGALCGELWAIETMLTTSSSPHDLARLESVADLIGADRRVLVSQATRPSGEDRRGFFDLDSLLELART